MRIREIEQIRRTDGFNDIALADLVDEIGELYEPFAEEKRLALKVRTESELIVRGEMAVLLGTYSGAIAPENFGRLDALIDAQELRTHELLLKYKKTILVAVAEVDDAIKGYRAARQTLKDVETALAESRHALDLATGRYERGLTEFLNVVDAERQLYTKEDERIVAQEAVALQFVLLYKALGGGWERYDLLPPIRGAEPAIVAMFRRLSNQWQ